MGDMKASQAVPLPTLGEVNDLGKPWRYLEEGYTVTRTAPWSPPGCHPVGCGLKLYVDENGKLAKVEGDENQPITQGRLCVRCLTLKDYLYNPSRITYPLKRAKEHRGQADKWERCTWDEALDIIEENYRRITAEYGRESVVGFAGTGREGGTLGIWRSLTFRTCNWCYSQSGYACYVPRMAAAAYNIGSPYPEIDYAGGLAGRYDDPAFELPECVVIWGKMPLASNPDGLFGHAVVDLMRRGSRLIVVDPRVTWLAARAEYHLRLRAGTDTALAMAMLNTIIEEDLYDHDFVEYWCYGFEQLAARVAEMPAEKAGEICGIDPDYIKGAARMYANAKPASIAWGLAFDQKANGMQLSHSIICLMAVTANLDVPGGQILGDASAGQNESGFGFKFIGEETLKKMIGLKEYPAYANTIQNAHADLTLRALETGEPYPIKMGFYAGNNLHGLHVGRTQALARRHGEVAGLLLHARLLHDALCAGHLRRLPSAGDRCGRGRRGLRALRRHPGGHGLHEQGPFHRRVQDRHGSLHDGRQAAEPRMLGTVQRRVRLHQPPAPVQPQ